MQQNHVCIEQGQREGHGKEEGEVVKGADLRGRAGDIGKQQGRAGQGKEEAE